MQRIAVISDVHSNLQACVAVLDRITELSCDTIWCLGDVVGYGSRPVECLGLVRDAAAVCIQGNHDALVASGGHNFFFNPRSLAAVDHNRKLLDEEALAWLRTLPVRHQEPDGTVLAHGSPDDRDRYLITANELETTRAAEVATVGPGVTFFGHTHQPVFFSSTGAAKVPLGRQPLAEGERVLVNPGSVGQPRDGDPRAAFLWWDREAAVLNFERVEYDVQAARREILEAGLPERLGDRLLEGR